MRKILLLIFGGIVALCGAELTQPSYKLNPITLTNKNCKSGLKAKLCLSKTLTYPTTDLLDISIKKALGFYIDKALYEYKRESVDNFSDGIDLDKDELINGDYIESNSLALFDYVEPIMVISQEYYSYIGGAHGLGGSTFINYDIQNQKEVHLDDIVDWNNSKFLHIAQREYKKSMGILPLESLEESGWFENKFILANTFALTSKGILFRYNPYEIKSYAYGESEFLLPYHYIEPFIINNNISTLARKQPIDSQRSKVISTDDAKMVFKIKNRGNGLYNIQIDVSIYNSSRRVWLSLSFPQFDNSTHIRILDSSHTKSFKLYRVGSKIYSNEYKRSMRSIYPLLEASAISEYEIGVSFEIQKPQHIPYFCMNYRLTDKKGDIIPTEDNGEDYRDQQGYIVGRVCLE